VANAIVDVMEGEWTDLNWELAIIDEKTVNAFVLPGGKISVYVGILDVAKNQDQLAAVIGHEVAHVTARHANERASRGVVTGVGVEVAAVILGGGHSGYTKTAYDTLSAGAALGIFLPFNRSQESEADVVGIEYMAKAGFDPRESVTLWKNMAVKNEKEPPEWLSTHPSGSSRIDHLIAQYPKVLVLYNDARAQGKDPQCK
jgi:predicted Zn-dependent protease